MKLTIIAIKFLFLGGLFIVTNNNLPLNSAENLGTFFDLYYHWISTLFSHSEQISGYVINSEWLPS